MLSNLVRRRAQALLNSIALALNALGLSPNGLTLIGFGLIAARLVWHSSTGWKGKLVTLFLTGGVLLLGTFCPVAPAKLAIPALAALVVVFRCC